MGTAANVRVGVTGAIYGAPLATPLPTTAIAALDEDFEDLGYISDEGVTESQGTDQKVIKAWQNGDTVRKIQTSHDLTYAFAFLEETDDTMKAFYGNSAAGVVEIRGEQGLRQSWIIEVVDDDHILRIVIPDGQVTEREDVTFLNEEAISYGVTITCYPDADGVKAYQYRAVAA